MDECKRVDTPMCQKEKLSKEDEAEPVDETFYRSLVGCLMYLTATRPDILHSISLLSRFTNCATETHLTTAKRVLRYVKGTLSFGIKFCTSQDCILQGYSDSDWGGSLDDLKSTSGYCFFFGSSVFSWCCKKQDTVAQSTTEVEFIAANAAVNQGLWLRKVLVDLNMKQEGCTYVFVDNQAAISISNNPVFYGKTKHFNIKLFFLREMQKVGTVRLTYCKSELQLADIFTKPLPRSKFEFLREKLGVCSNQSKEEC